MDMSVSNAGVQYERISETNCSQAFLGNNPQVNLSNGSLRYVFGDASVGYGNFSVDVNHVYNSKTNAVFAVKSAGFGRNWKLNLTQLVLFDNFDSNGKKIYKYLDEQGDVHRFVQFDADRYYDDRNAKVVLSKTQSGYEIKDGVGNALRFNPDGFLTESVSCQNSAVKKVYEYDGANRLVCVYDARSVKNGVAKNRVELEYENELLSAITAYASYHKKVFRLRYAYNGNKNLVSVDKIAFNNMSQECISKRAAEFSYNLGLLSEVFDPETKLASKISYLNGRVAVLSDGVVTQNCLKLGSKCKNGENALFCGKVNSGLSFRSDFSEKSRSSYSYRFLSDGDDLAVETDVTNIYDITIAYFLDRCARITSSFEKDGSNLKPLSVQRGLLWKNFTGDSSQTINGVGTVRFKENRVFNGIVFEVARNQTEKSCKRFAYSFWLKTSEIYDVLEAKIVCTYREGDDNAIDASQRSVKTGSTVFLDPVAVGAWQKVTLPFAVPEGFGTDCFKTLEINLTANKQANADNYETVDIGFEPMPYSEMFLKTQYVDLPLKNANKVKLNYTTENISKDLYFTDSDVIATCSVRNGKNINDVICNNCEKRMLALGPLQFGFPFAPQDVWADVSASKPFYTKTLLPADGADVTTLFSYGEMSLTMENVYKKTVDEKEYVSRSSVKTDYKGNTLSQTDEYGTSVENKYDAFGNLLETTVKNGDSVESVQRFFYDEEGRCKWQNNGATGQSFSYDESDRLCQTQETKISNGEFVSSSHSASESFGVYPNKVLGTREFDGETQVAENKVTYENGSVKTVSDGLAKYGVLRDLQKNRTDYTQFDGARETLVQRDIAYLLWDYYGDEYQNKFYKTNNVSEFFDSLGNKIGSSSAVVDCYGKAQSLSRNFRTSGEEFIYSYGDVTESRFVLQPSDCRNVQTNERTRYRYDGEDKLIGWKETEVDGSGSEQTVFEVQQVAPETTKYIFDPQEEYFTAISYDVEKTAAPRITAVVISEDKIDSKDRPTELTAVNYRYDSFGKVTKKGSKYSFSDYSYETRNSVAELRKAEHSCLLMGEGKYSLEEKLSYYDNGLVKQEKFNYTEYLNNTVTVNSLENVKTYAYDNARRVTQEINTLLGINRRYTYNSFGRLKEITDKSGAVTRYNYDGRGRLSSLSSGALFSYDNYGNRIEQTDEYGNKKTYKYGCGGMLLKAGDTEYKYNAEGVRFKKVRNGETVVRYYLDGNKILGEDRGNCKLRYFYDLDGIAIIRIKTGKAYEDYEVKRDSRGNVTMLVQKDTAFVACLYEYDMFGNCEALLPNGERYTYETGIGLLNPFRWKGFYLDRETNLYYANGSYYDPKTGLYVDSSPIYTVFDNALTTRCIDRNGILCDNILELASSPFTAYPARELSADPEYSVGYSWLEKAFDWWNAIPKWIKIGIGILTIVILAIATVLTGGAAGGLAGAVFAGALKGSVIGATSGAIVSGTIEGIIFACNKQGFWRGFANGATDGFMFGAISGAIAGGIEGANGWYNAKAIEFTHNANSKEVVLGRSGVYEAAAIERGATYYHMSAEQWAILSKHSTRAWKINKAFLKQQIKAGKTFLLASPVNSGGYFFQKEIKYISKFIKYRLL